jgi:hydroxyacylglutathione hydrolase
MAVSESRRLAQLAPRGAEPVADGVWLVRGGLPRRRTADLITDGRGVLHFDPGIRQMAPQLEHVAAALGGITRIVLSHSHVDHRGAAPELEVPVWCHFDERANAEGDGGMSEFDLSVLNPVTRRVLPRLWRRWDGGPVKISGTLEEGDQVAGFEVIHLPGHAPGQIALWRESTALSSLRIASSQSISRPR